jgi:hypothetical protein
MRRWWIPLFWLAFALVATLQTWIAMITHGHSLLRLAFYEVAVWSGWVLLTPAVFGLARRYPLERPRLRHIGVHAGAAAVLGTLHVVWWVAATVLIRPYDPMPIEGSPNFPEALLVRMPLEIIFYAGTLAAAHAIDFSRRAAELDRSLARARLHALELQIRPHFLFNTLNTISALVRARKDAEAVEVVAGLADLLRYTLDHQGEQNVTLEQEAAMLGRYLEIQRTRFADRLQVSIDVAPDARRAAVPTLILQPLAENAIRHGIDRSAQPGRVEVRAFRRQESLQIEIFNTGSLGTPEGGGIGLRNTADRLRQLYGAAHRFELRQIADGVLASLCIPWSEVA